MVLKKLIGCGLIILHDPIGTVTLPYIDIASPTVGVCYRI